SCASQVYNYTVLTNILLLTFLIFSYPLPPPPSTLSLHDALPICPSGDVAKQRGSSLDDACHSLLAVHHRGHRHRQGTLGLAPARSEEHTSELQSLRHLVCRLLLEKKKKIK